METRTPAVWRLAVDLAGSADRVTAEHTKKALAQWKKINISGCGTNQPVKTDEAEHERGQAMWHAFELYNLSKESPCAQDQWQQFDQWNRQFRKTGQW
jgi:hypothetical protein